MYENSQKTQLNQRTSRNLQSHLAYKYTKMCTLIRHKIYESFVKICATKCRSFFLQTQSSVANLPIESLQDNLEQHAVILVNISDLFISWYRRETNRQNSKISDRKISYLCLTRAYIWSIWVLDLFGSRKNSGNIYLPISKSKLLA